MYIRFGDSDITDLDKSYDIEWFKRDITRAYEAIEWLKNEYIPAITAQANRVIQMESKFYIVIRREQNRWSRDKKVKYFVSIRKELWEDGKLFRVVYDHNSEDKKFTGLERKLALTYVEELRRKYNYPILREGF